MAELCAPGLMVEEGCEGDRRMMRGAGADSEEREISGGGIMTGSLETFSDLLQEINKINKINVS